MSDEQPTRSISLEIEIDAPKDAVWRAITTGEELARWFPPISDGKAEKVGDKVLISWGKDMEWWTSVAAIEPGEHVRFQDALVLDWYLETRKGKTVVRLVNSGFSTGAEWDDQFDATEAGWKYFLFNLKHYLERHRGTPRVQLTERRKSERPRTEVLSRLTQELTPSTTSVRLGDETMPGVIEHRSERGLWLRLPSLNDALLFVEMEPGKKGFHTGMWLSLYGVAADRVESVRSALRQSADRVFA